MFSSDEWRCHAMRRHPVVSHRMPLDWTLAKTTLEWKRRLFRRRCATPVLISLATATPVISFLVVFFCFVLSASRSSSCFALSARLERHRLVCHVKDHLERLWLELSKRLARIQVLESAASSGKHGNTSATSDTDILKVWHAYKTKKGGKKQIYPTRFTDVLSTI